MDGKFKGLAIIGVTLLLAIGGVVAFAVMQNSGTNTSEKDPHVHDDGHSHESSDAEQANEVTIVNYAYAPKTVEVKVGTTVTWTNQDSVDHTVTTEESAPVSFDSGLFGKGESFSYTFEEAGQYDYYCLPHLYMKGTVIVTE